MIFTILSISPYARQEMKVAVKRQFADLPLAIRHDAVLAIIVCEVVHGVDADPYWLEVKCSKDSGISTVVQIANHFLGVIDVEAYNPQTGAFIFREKGGKPVLVTEL